MSKFIKKAEAIDAYQMTLERRGHVCLWPEWLKVAWNKKITAVNSLSPIDYPSSNGKDKLVTHTVHGPVTVDWGDWIVRRANGDLHVWKDSIFALTFEAVDEH